MAALTEISIDVKKIDKSKLYKGQYLNLVVHTRDELSQYGQNVGVYYSQSKEERDAKEKKQYLGNGKVIWTDGNINTAKDLTPAETASLSSDLEF